MIKCHQRPIRGVVAIGTLTAVVMPICDVAAPTIGIRFVVENDLFPDIRIGVAAQAISFVMVEGGLRRVAGDTFNPTAVFIGRFPPVNGIGVAFDTLSRVVTG